MSDPTHVLRDYLSKEGLTTVDVTPKERKSYYNKFEHGIVQPGILCIKSDRTVVYSWTSEPNEVSDYVVWSLYPAVLSKGDLV